MLVWCKCPVDTGVVFIRIKATNTLHLLRAEIDRSAGLMKPFTSMSHSISIRLDHSPYFPSNTEEAEEDEDEGYIQHPFSLLATVCMKQMNGTIRDDGRSRLHHHYHRHWCDAVSFLLSQDIIACAHQLFHVHASSYVRLHLIDKISFSSSYFLFSFLFDLESLSGSLSLCWISIQSYIYDIHHGLVDTYLPFYSFFDGFATLFRQGEGKQPRDSVACLSAWS